MFKKFLILLLTVTAFAQTGRTVTLVWDDLLNGASATWNVKRASASCASSPTFTTLASNVSVKTYQDTNVLPGTYCYALSANVSGLESANSSPAAAVVIPFPPTFVTVTIQ